MENELEVLSKTDHPYITRVIELLEDSSSYYIISEVVPGGELYDYIIKNKMFDERIAAKFVKQILLAINYMHQQNIVHRDIKPENVLIQSITAKDITLKLTDFGFATIMNPAKGESQVLGSPLYMAPEIVRQEIYNSKVDIWSIGVLTHILLSGCPPFFGKTKQDIYKSILESSPKFGRVNNTLSANSKDFVIKCLSKMPSNRPTAEQLLQHPFIKDY